MLESKKTTRYVFYVYLMLLTWGILFKFETNPEFIAFFLAPRYINWIPFSEPLIVDGKIVFAEMLF
ncbi:TPA: VanZ family protein, partial [Streptococcus pneumoniae]